MSIVIDLPAGCDFNAGDLIVTRGRKDPKAYLYKQPKPPIGIVIKSAKKGAKVTICISGQFVSEGHHL